MCNNRATPLFRLSKFKQKSDVSSLLLCLLIMCTGCTQYRTMRIDRYRVSEDITEAVPAYAVMRNGMIIPEYVINRKGEYPETKEEAEKLFRMRYATLESFVIISVIVSESSKERL